MKRYLILMLCVLLFNSCGKFLEEFSQDLAYAESCADLDEILIGNGLWSNRRALRRQVFTVMDTIPIFT